MYIYTYKILFYSAVVRADDVLVELYIIITI